MSTICCCGCCCENDENSTAPSGVSRLATHFTLWLGIAYGGLSLAACFGSSSWLPWCDGLGTWCTDLIPTNTITVILLAIASGIELFRWIFLRGQLSMETGIRRRSTDQYDDGPNEFNALDSPSSVSSRHRPWWWNRHGNELQDPLLESEEDGTTTRNGQPPWAVTSWFTPQRRSRRILNRTDTTGTNASVEIEGDEEDVASVLDSLGEDWASRAEDDPYWWTR